MIEKLVEEPTRIVFTVGELDGEKEAPNAAVSAETDDRAHIAQAVGHGIFSSGYARSIVRSLARAAELEWAAASHMPLAEQNRNCAQIAKMADGVAENALALGDLRTAERACGVSTLCHALRAFAAGAGQKPGGRP